MRVTPVGCINRLPWRFIAWLIPAVLLLSLFSCAHDERRIDFPDRDRTATLIERLERGTQSERIAAGAELARMGPAVLPSIRKGLPSTTPQGAPVLMGLIAQWQDKEALPLLEQLSRKRNDTVALGAIECMGRLDVRDVLENIVRDEGRPLQQRITAVRSLALSGEEQTGEKSGNEERERFLLGLLDLPCGPLAGEALGSLRFLGSEKFREYLPRFLDCNDRLTAAFAAPLTKGSVPPPLESHVWNEPASERPAGLPAGPSGNHPGSSGQDKESPRVVRFWQQDMNILREAARKHGMGVDAICLPARLLDVPDRFRSPFVERLLTSPFAGLEQAWGFITAVTNEYGATPSLAFSPPLTAAHRLLADQSFSPAEPVSSAGVLEKSFSRAVLDVFHQARECPLGHNFAVLNEFDSLLPGDLSRALGGLFGAIAVLRETWEKGCARLAHGDLDWLEQAAVRLATPGEVLNRDERIRFEALAAEVDWIEIRAVEATLFRALEKAVAELRKPEAVQCFVKARLPLIINTPIGDVAFYGPQADTVTQNGILVIDTGGNDHIECAAGAATKVERVSVYIDLDGDDDYAWTAGPAFGSGVLGTGVLVDLQGNDSYRSARFSQGAGMLGTGLLYDRVGNDIYRSGFMSQGAAACGTGVLVDDAGDDSYGASCTSQGFGGPGGVGILVDRRGNDWYRATGGPSDTARDSDHALSMSQGFGMGVRSSDSIESFGSLSGGVGLLCDLAGDDIYEVDLFGQGAGYYFGGGLLMDGSGDDRYVGYNYVQGAGIHSAFGLLLDGSGDDRYLGFHHCAGLGLDRGVGILFDLAGEDLYQNLTDCQGSGVKPLGLGVLVDQEGDDVYQCSSGRGYARTPELWPSQWPAGFFLDRHGHDMYDGRRDFNGLMWYRPERGLGVDAD